MRVVLRDLTSNKYNGREAIVTNANDKGILAIRIDGRTFSVKLHNVIIYVPSEALEVCPICQDIMLPGTTNMTMCKHVFHTECIEKWKRGAGLDVESGHTRCPTCRAYVGVSTSMAKDFKTSINLDLNPQCTLQQILGAVFQAHQQRTKGKDASLAEEVAFLLTCCTMTPSLARAQRKLQRNMTEEVAYQTMMPISQSLFFDPDLQPWYARMEKILSCKARDPVQLFKKAERDLTTLVLSRAVNVDSVWEEVVDTWLATQIIDVV